MDNARIIIAGCFLSVILLAFFAMDGAKDTIKVVFFGDSITESGAESGGYIRLMEEKLKEQNSADQFQLVGAGISGNKVYDLYLRLNDDVLSQNPDVVVVWIGINDVWHKKSGTGTDHDKFEEFYSAIIKKLQEENIEVILATPGVIGEKTDHTNEQDGDLNRYAESVRSLADEYECGLVDFREIFLNYNRDNNPENKASDILTTDGVHLNEKGNELAAEQLLKALG